MQAGCSCHHWHVGGVAAMALANHERLKQRVETLEKRQAQAEWRGGINRAGLTGTEQCRVFSISQT
jgi:hypothetical protein